MAEDPILLPETESNDVSTPQSVDPILLPEGTPTSVEEKIQMKKPITWEETATTAASNIPSSTVKYAKDIVYPITHPIETFNAFKQLSKGIYSKGEGLFYEQDPKEKEKNEAALNALGTHFSNRYGSVEGFKREFAKDPVSFLGDISMVLSGGALGAARLPGTVSSTVAKGLRKAADVTDPMALAVKTAKGVAKVTSPLISLKGYWATGASMRSLNAATKAALEKNPVFWDHYTGKAGPQDLIDAVDSAITQMKIEKNRQFSQGMAPITNTPVNMAPIKNQINQSINDIRRGQSQDVGAGARNALTEAISVYQNYARDPGIANVGTVGFWQDVKNKINRDVRSNINPRDTFALKAVDDFTRSISKGISDAAPEYAKVMEKYESALNDISKLRDELGTSKAPAGRRLYKILKNNDKIGKGSLIDDLAKINKDIPYMIAGQELRPLITESGLRKAAVGSAAIMGFPVPVIKTAAASSPKGWAAVKYGLGAGPRYLEDIQRKFSPFYRPLYPAGRFTQEVEEPRPLTIRGKRPTPATGGRIERKAGGRISPDAHADRLVAAAESAKRRLVEETKPLLNEDDNTIAKALEIANQHV